MPPTHHDQRLQHSSRPTMAFPAAYNDVLARMIQAEENEGSPPLPEPCDTPYDTVPTRVGGIFTTEPEHTMEACPAPEHVMHLPLGQRRQDAQSSVLLKAAGMELIRLVIPAEKEIPPHRVPGEVTVQCVEGRVAFTHNGSTAVLSAGDLLYLCPNELHSVKGLEDSTVLVTRLRPHVSELAEGETAVTDE